MTAVKTKAPTADVIRDDRAVGFRIKVNDGHVAALLPSAVETEHPFYAGTCAAVALDGPRTTSDRTGLLWIQWPSGRDSAERDEENLEAAVRRAADAAVAALSPLTAGEVNALRMFRFGFTPAKRFVASLRAKHLVDDAGKITPAGIARSKTSKSRGSS